MIKIQRASAPEVLADSPSEGMHYNKKEVVERLWEMQHGKCSMGNAVIVSSESRMKDISRLWSIFVPSRFSGT